MEFLIREARQEDMDDFIRLRMDVLREANCLCPGTDMSNVEAGNRAWYARTMGSSGQVVLLAYGPDGALAGCGAVCYHERMPTCDAPSGRCGTVMDMYTVPEFRGLGLGRMMLERLIAHAKANGCERLGLDASEQGRRLYSRYGFVEAANEMVWEGVLCDAGDAADR